MKTLTSLRASACTVHLSPRTCTLPSHLHPRPKARHVAVSVAAIEEQASDQSRRPTLPNGYQVQHLQAQYTEEELLDELELLDLDSAQETLLAWSLMSKEDSEQEEDLDEALDYDEFTDAEYAHLVGHDLEHLVGSADAPLHVGDLVPGTVFEVDDKGAYVELGQKAAGFVPLAECSFGKLKSPREVLQVGMQRDFVVVEQQDGQVVLSLAAAEATAFWQRIHQMYSEEATVMVRVADANRGGLLVRYGPQEGFVPVSQLAPDVNVETMSELVGKDIPVMFLEVDEANERLVFSQKRVQMGTADSFKEPQVGDVVEGVVQTVRPYGVFVDIGGVSGLLHVSQISSMRLPQPATVFKEGERIKVLVLAYDRDKGRVTLSTKRLEATPGEMLRNPQAVYDNAEAAAELLRQQLAAVSQQVAAADPLQLDGELRQFYE